MKKLLVLITIFFISAISLFSQDISEAKVKTIVKKALIKTSLDYGRIKIKHGYYKMEYKLVYNGKKIAKAEKKVKLVPNMKISGLLQDFEEELTSKLKSATIEKVEHDSDLNVWRVYIDIKDPEIKISEIKVDGTVGAILAY
jgi:hypothetical protein